MSLFRQGERGMPGLPGLSGKPGDKVMIFVVFQICWKWYKKLVITASTCWILCSQNLIQAWKVGKCRDYLYRQKTILETSTVWRWLHESHRTPYVLNTKARSSGIVINSKYSFCAVGQDLLSDFSSALSLKWHVTIPTVQAAQAYNVILKIVPAVCRHMCAASENPLVSSVPQFESRVRDASNYVFTRVSTVFSTVFARLPFLN